MCTTKYPKMKLNACNVLFEFCKSYVEHLNSYVYSPAVGMSVSLLLSFLDEGLIRF